MIHAGFSAACEKKSVVAGVGPRGGGGAPPKDHHKALGIVLL